MLVVVDLQNLNAHLDVLALDLGFLSCSSVFISTRFLLITAKSRVKLQAECRTANLGTNLALALQVVVQVIEVVQRR